ncbi:BCS1 N terminal-domain-containing protein [Neohortaea acidophila]|uniref:BCS1 N terminal-domain-containing protein n=1 Tax=Neohortaea acidophila TaxID=245834 RepID=A0A6A6PT70_9PEZI|nr:BCS1 N terminal-domain-containing protein [Neohortaea acidophila]KAF2483299.1 BCS1 N terminal-domain-containing protein [Neohortaea acidophila]
MDFRRLSKLQPQQATNASDPLSLTELPSNILDALLPGYSLISKYALSALGLDISLFVSVAVIALASLKGGQYLYNKATSAFRYFLVSSVYIDEHDDLFDMLMDWLATTHTSSSRRSVRAKTTRANDEFDGMADDALDSEGMFDYNRWSARTPPRYEPYYGRHIIWHNGSVFFFRRSQKQTVGQSLQVRWGNSSEDDIVQLDCLGRSVEPIRQLLRTVKIWSLQRQRNKTTIRHPTAKDRARFSGSWSKTFARPSRPMDTVILDAEQKNMIINDMNEYLHPLSPKWYATRGIPYRRGYLFHGPPGTGKTSLSFALAGIFGLEIYVISLQEPTLSEGDLMQLFNGLPKRCIVLLEDVDAAGLIRDGRSDAEPSDAKAKSKRGGKTAPEAEQPAKDASATETKETKPAETDYTLKDLARELKSISSSKGSERTRDAPNRQPGTGISLSGLLNAIDGVASHEGRVLIMTTNHPEKLDAALVRPGRVDRRVKFALAKKPQIEELFYRMYVSSETPSATNGHVSEKQVNGHANGNVTSKPSKTVAVDDDLDDLARKFASHIPDDTFTPAEIQNHLMRYKDEPRVALEKVDEWMKEAMSEKQDIEDAENGSSTED